MFNKKKQNHYKSTVHKKREREKSAKSVVRIVFLTILALGIAGVVSVGCIYGYRLLVSTKYFDIQEIQVSGNDIYIPKEIIEISGLKMNQNIFLTNLAVSQKNLLLQPWIEKAIVARVLPNKVKIEIQEYAPLAIIETNGKRYLLNTNGIPFKEWAPTDPIKLPVVIGFSLADFKAEKPSQKAQTLLYFLTANSQRGAILTNHAIRKISMDSSGNITLFPIQGVNQVRLGKNNFEVKLKRIYEILPHLYKERNITAYDTIDASNIDKITFRQKS